MSKFKTLAKASINYALVQYIVIGIGFVKGLIIAKHLGPELLGSYGLMVLILEYLRFANLGISSAMNLEVSVLMSEEGKEKVIKHITNTTFTYTIIVGAVLILASVIIDLFASGIVAQDIKRYLYILFFIAVCGQFKVYAVIHARLKGNYKFINKVELISNVTNILLILATIFTYNLDGVILALAISSLMTIAYSIYHVLPDVSLELDKKMLWKLIMLGIPILMYNSFEKVFMSVDRIVIVNYFTREELGYYTLGYTLLASTMVILSSITFLIYPKFISKFSVKNLDAVNKKAMYENLINIGNGIENIAVGLCTLGLFLVIPFIQIFLPQYQITPTIYQLLILGIVFEKIAYLSSVYMVSNKYQWLLTGMLFFFGLIGWLLNYIVVKINLGLTGIAGASLLAIFFYSTSKISVVLNDLDQLHFKSFIRMYGRYFLYLLFVLPIVILKSNYSYFAIPLFILIYSKGCLQTFRRFWLKAA